MVGGDLASAPGAFAPGAQIGGYEIAEQIGQGGMAVVYRARDIRLGRWVALKVLAPEFAGDDAFRQRFIRESRAAAAVDHPHIIPIFEAGEASGALFIAMRYVSGRDVRGLLDAEGALPAGRAIAIVAQVASALDAAHGAGLVHRDDKPANFLLGEPRASGAAEHVYLSDFGLSKQSLPSSGLTLTGQFLGTLDYVAPEQIEGGPVDGRADVYSLACTAFELLSGAPPFRRDQGLAVLWAQISAPPPALTSRRPDLPPVIDQVMTKAMAKAPDDRYQTCGAFAAALQAASGLSQGDLAAGTGPSGGAAMPLRSATEVAMPAVGLAAESPIWPPTQSGYVPGQRPTVAGQAGSSLRPDAFPPPSPSSPQSPGRPPRSRRAIAAACVAVLALAGVAFAVLHGGRSAFRCGGQPVVSPQSRWTRFPGGRRFVVAYRTDLDSTGRRSRRGCHWDCRRSAQHCADVLLGDQQPGLRPGLGPRRGQHWLVVRRVRSGLRRDRPGQRCYLGCVRRRRDGADHRPADQWQRQGLPGQLHRQQRCHHPVQRPAGQLSW
jgi:serine/threonine-protein kinase